MSFLSSLFNRKDELSNSRLTPYYLQWEKGVLALRAQIAKMGNNPIQESRAQLIVRFMEEKGIFYMSPFANDPDMVIIRQFLEKHKAKH